MSSVTVSEASDTSGPASFDVADPKAQIHGPMLFVAVGVLAMTNFMALLDMTIVNVSVPHIAGSLAAAPHEATWAITSYAVAEAVMVPLTSWLGRRFGAVRVHFLCVLGFGLFSACCGLSSSLTMLVIFRTLQGMCGGPLMPMSQILLLRIAPKHSRNQALGMWAMTVVLAPVVGPILGGAITDGPGWPWAFYINVPIALICAFFCWRLLASRETETAKTPVDYVGFALLALWICAIQVMLDNGHDQDWFSSPMIVGLLVAAIIGFISFVIWEATDDHPVVDLRVFLSPGYALASLIMVFIFGAFFASIVLIPLWLQSNLGYTATWAGYVVAFNGVFGVVMSPIVAALMSRVDPRALMFTGLSVIATATLYRATFTPGMSFLQLILPQFAYGFGMPMFFIPIMNISVAVVPPAQTSTAASLVNFMRSMSAAFATAIVTSMWYDQSSLDRAQLVGRLHHAGSAMAALGGSSHNAQRGLMILDNMVDNQSVMLATNQTFMYVGVVVVLLAASVWLLPRIQGPSAAPTGH
jgi:DHA2 family multidrug resistance protein